MTLEEAQQYIGAAVARTRPYEGALIEQGVITSANDVYVFVRYGSDSGSKATRADELELLAGDATPFDTW